MSARARARAFNTVNPAGGGGGGAVTMSVVAEYVDTSGTRQSVTLASNGSTTINIRKYGNVAFNAAGTRSSVSDCDTEGEAYFNMGFRAKYGEGSTGNWPYNGDSSTRTIDQEWGQPVFNHVYTVVGTNTTTFRGRDSAGNEADISCSVVVSNYANTSNIAVGAGAWPTWASDTLYTLTTNNGGYTGFGDIQTYPTAGGATSGLHNIAILGTGVCTVAQFRVDDRNNVSAGAVTRAAGIRLINCDTTGFIYGYVGYDFCGTYACRVRAYVPGAGGETGFGYDEAVKNNRGQTTADNIRYPRGGFCVLGRVDGDTYVYIRAGSAMCFQGNELVVTTGVKEHVYRPYNANSVLRNNLMRSDIACKSWVKGSAMSSSYTETPGIWRSDDAAGDWTLARALFSTYGEYYAGDTTRNIVPGQGPQPDHVNFTYAYQSKNNAFEWNQWGDAAQAAADSVAGQGPQNNDVWDQLPPYTTNGSFELVSYSSIENNRTFLTTPFTGTAIEMSGLHVGVRNNITNMGAGSNISVTTNTGPNKVPSASNGPYYTTGTRPVPTAI